MNAKTKSPAPKVTKAAQTAKAIAAPTMPAKKGRGRPQIGSAIPVRLSDEHHEYVKLAGNSVAAEGIRRSIATAKRLDALEGLSDALLDKARALGEGDLAKGVTLAVNAAAQASHQRSADSVRALDLLSLSDTEVLCALGDGDFERGLSLAVNAATVLGADTIHRIAGSKK
jgi:hypothetical protein